MPRKKVQTPPSPPPPPTYSVSNNTFVAEAAKLGEPGEHAIVALANASAAHAVALQKIAELLQTAGGTIETAVHIGDKAE